MPFTLAHPAAATPFARYGLPLSALAVGSMAPDFPYFVPGLRNDHFGHSWPGVVLFCIPAGLVVLWIFHDLLKLPLLSLLPANHRARLSTVAATFRFGPPRHFIAVLLGLLLGALTHIAWDSFTHAGGWMVQHVALLRSPLLRTSHGKLFVFKALQYGGSIGGMSLLAWWYFLWFRKAPKQQLARSSGLSKGRKRQMVITMLVVAFVLAAISSYCLIASFEGLDWFQLFVRDFIVGTVRVLCGELVIFSIAWHLRRISENSSVAD